MIGFLDKQVDLSINAKRSLSSITLIDTTICFRSRHILPKPSHSTVPSNDAFVPHPPQSTKCHKSKNKEHMHVSGSLEAFQTAAEPLKDSWTFGYLRTSLLFAFHTKKKNLNVRI